MFVFTSCTNNYIPKARILASTLKLHHPSWVFCLLLGEAPPSGFTLAEEPFDRLLTFDQLNIPDYPSWLFRHRVVEICTAAKGPALVHFLEREKHEKVMYLDPDIMVCNTLAPLDELLTAHDLLLTPHLLTPQKTPKSIVDNELCAMQYGVFNLGFVAAAARGDGFKFARWWRDRLLQYCYDDIPHGLFTDQRWCNMAPAFFPGLHVVRDPGCNAASWNLAERTITRDESGVFFANNTPLRFYHFTGYDSGMGEDITTQYAEDMPAVHELWALYRKKLEASGQAVLGKLRWIHMAFNDGTPVSDSMRLLYRDRKDLQAAFPDPFQRPGFLEWYLSDQNTANVVPGVSQSKLKTILRRGHSVLRQHGGFPRGLPSIGRQVLIWVRKWGLIGMMKKIWNSDPQAVRQEEELLPLGALLGAPECAPARNLFRLLSASHNPVCVIEHDWGGGADTYCQARVNTLLAEGRAVIRLRCIKNTKQLKMTVCYGNESRSYGLDNVRELADGRFPHIQGFIVNELAGWYFLYQDLAGTSSFAEQIDNIQSAVRGLAEVARRHKAHVEFLFHDYFSVCPTIYLLTPEHRYCGLPENSGECDVCALRGKPFSMLEWRRAWGELLGLANEVVFFSEHTRDTATKIYPLRKDQIRVRPHTVLPFATKVSIPAAGPMRVAVVGLIQQHKGLGIVLRLADLLQERMPEAAIIVFGRLEARDLPENIIELGPYVRSNLPTLMEEHKITVGLFPSVCPESFSYVAHEMGALGLPMVAFDLGAQGAYVRTLPGGRIASDVSAQAALEALLQLDAERLAAACASQSIRQCGCLTDASEETYCRSTDI